MTPRYLPTLFLGACIGALSLPAQAASCSSTQGNYSIALDTRNIPRDAPIGSVVIPKVVGFPGYQVTCLGDSNNARDAYLDFRVNAMPSPGFADVYPTNIAGLGAKYHFASNNTPNCTIPFDQTISNTAYTLVCHLNNNDRLVLTMGSSVEFIKTGPISAGTVSTIPRVSLSYRLNHQFGVFPLSNFFSGVITGQTTIASCTTPNVMVNLGDHITSELNAVGKFTSSTDFDIPLNSCPSGIRTIKYQVDAATRILDADRAIVALNSSSTAQGGIGVQLLDRSNNAHKLGAANTLAGTTTNGGNFRIPLRARYYRTGPVISSGTAGTSMTFTIFYE